MKLTFCTRMNALMNAFNTEAVTTFKKKKQKNFFFFTENL